MYVQLLCMFSYYVLVAYFLFRHIFLYNQKHLSLLQISPGTSSHTRIRLSDKGLKKVNTTSSYGDHYVHIKVKIPKSLSEKQQALMLAYAELEQDTPGIIRGITLKKDGKQQKGPIMQNINSLRLGVSFTRILSHITFQFCCLRRSQNCGLKLYIHFKKS